MFGEDPNTHGQVTLTGTAGKGRAGGSSFPAQIWQAYTTAALKGQTTGQFDLDDARMGTPAPSRAPSPSGTPSGSGTPTPSGSGSTRPTGTPDPSGSSGGSTPPTGKPTTPTGKPTTPTGKPTPPTKDPTPPVPPGPNLDDR